MNEPLIRPLQSAQFLQLELIDMFGSPDPIQQALAQMLLQQLKPILETLRLANS